MDKRTTHSDLANETVESLKEGTHYQRVIEDYDHLKIEQYQILQPYQHFQ